MPVELEAIAVVAALLYVLFAAMERSVCFVFGLISSAIYVYICFITKFYYDTFINAYYVVMSVWGWYSWNKKIEDNGIAVKKMKKGKLMVIAFAGLLATAAFGYFGENYLEASLPYLDSFTTVFALLATWMVVEKYLENWLIWVVVDAIGIGMYWYKELYFTAGLFFIYTVIAIIGYFIWRRKLIL